MECREIEQQVPSSKSTQPADIRSFTVTFRVEGTPGEVVYDLRESDLDVAGFANEYCAMYNEHFEDGFEAEITVNGVPFLQPERPEHYRPAEGDAIVVTLVHQHQRGTEAE